MIDFKVKRGLSSDLYIEPGVFNPRLIIEKGCWYLCTDTAELFLGVSVKDETTQEESLTLKQINGTHPEVPPKVAEELERLEASIKTIQSDVANLAAADQAFTAKLATLEQNAFSGNYEDLKNTPEIPSIEGLASEQYVGQTVNSAVNTVKGDIKTLSNAFTARLDTKLDKTGGIITNDVAIQGNLSVHGVTVTKNVESLLVKDNIIVANAKGEKIDTDVAGFVVQKDEKTSYGIMYDATRDGVAIGEGRLLDGHFTYGRYDDGNFTEDLHEGQLLATREEAIADKHIVVWDANGHILKDSGSSVSDILDNIRKETFANKGIIPDGSDLNYLTEPGVYCWIAESYDQGDQTWMYNAPVQNGRGNLIVYATDNYIYQILALEAGETYTRFGYRASVDATFVDWTNKPWYKWVNYSAFDGLATEAFVQEELAKIEIPDTSYFITEEEVDAKGYLTEVPAEYVTETELNNKGFITDISGKADKEHTHSISDISDYKAPDLSSYAKAADVDTDIRNVQMHISRVESDKQDKLIFDGTPTAGSTNPVTSDGVYNAIANVKITSNLSSALEVGSGARSIQQVSCKATGDVAIALGNFSKSTAEGGFSCGSETINAGDYGEAVGVRSKNFASVGHAGGDNSTNAAYSGFVHGHYLNLNDPAITAQDDSLPKGQAVLGALNVINPNAMFIVGNGLWGDEYRNSPRYGKHNAFEVLVDGRARVQSDPIEDKDVVRLGDLKKRNITPFTNDSISWDIYTCSTVPYAILNANANKDIRITLTYKCTGWSGVHDYGSEADAERLGITYDYKSYSCEEFKQLASIEQDYTVDDYGMWRTYWYSLRSFTITHLKHYTSISNSIDVSQCTSLEYIEGYATKTFVVHSNIKQLKDITADAIVFKNKLVPPNIENINAEIIFVPDESLALYKQAYTNLAAKIYRYSDAYLVSLTTADARLTNSLSNYCTKTDLKNNMSSVEAKIASLEAKLAALEVKSYVNTYSSYSELPETGEQNKLYVVIDEEKSYVWFNNSYLCISGGNQECDHEDPDVIDGGGAEINQN